jgi:hypothetical protein
MISRCLERIPGNEESSDSENDEQETDYDSDLLEEVIAEGSDDKTIKPKNEFSDEKPEIVELAENLISKNRYKQAYRCLLVAELQFPGNIIIKNLLKDVKSGLNDG